MCLETYFYHRIISECENIKNQGKAQHVDSSSMLWKEQIDQYPQSHISKENDGNQFQN